MIDSSDLPLLAVMFSLLAIPLTWIYRINSRITKVETTQLLKIERLDILENRLNKIDKCLNEIRGMLLEHLRRDK